MWNNFYEKSLRFKICYHCFTGFVAVHTCIFATKRIDGSIIIQNIDFLQIMTFAYFKVIRIMCRCNFYTSCSKFFVNILIRNNRDLTVSQRQFQHFADQIFVSFIIRIDCNCSISEKCFRTCSCDLYKSAFLTYDRIINVPEKSVLILMFYLCIRDGSLAYRTPVDDSGTFVNISFLIQTDKYFLYSLGASFVHCEAFSLPVCRSTEFLQLVDDLSAVLFFPCPRMFKEFFTSDIVFVDSFFFQFIDNLNLCCDCSMVGSRLPQSFVSLHSLETDQYILHGFIKCMSHMKLAGYVRRRHYDCKWFLIWIYFCVEVSVVHPFLIKAVFQTLWVICFCKFFAHNFLLIKKSISHLL